MRVILASASHAQVMECLQNYSFPAAEAVRMTCHAIAHGFYRSRRVYLDYDGTEENFLLVVKQ